MEAARDHRSKTANDDARARRAHAAREARGLLAGQAGTRVLSDELLAERREEARLDERGRSSRRHA